MEGRRKPIYRLTALKEEEENKAAELDFEPNPWQQPQGANVIRENEL